MYQDKKDHQLLSLLAIYNKLTLKAQLNLQAAIKRRGLDADLEHLNKAISEKNTKIKNLHYLKNMGFELDDKNEMISISRTGKAVVMDFVAVFTGLILCFVGIYSIIALIQSFYSEEDLNIFLAIVQAAAGYLAILGFQFLSGLNRLIDNSGFELFGLDQMITLRKRLDFKKVEIHKKPAELDIVDNEEEVSLELAGVQITATQNENYVHKKTLKELKSKLQRASN